MQRKPAKQGMTPAERIRALRKLQRELKAAGVDFEQWQKDIQGGRR